MVKISRRHQTFEDKGKIQNEDSQERKTKKKSKEVK